MVICTICQQSVHSSNSCSTNTKTNIDNEQHLCTTCKLKRKSLSASTIPNTGRRSGQSTNLNSGRGSASYTTKPSLNTIHATRRTLGSNSSPTTVLPKSTCSITSNTDLQKQIDKIVSSLDELDNMHSYPFS